MPSTYDILGLIIGIVSLLAFTKQIQHLISSRLPPGRVRGLEASIVELRTLVDRIEGGSRFGVGDGEDAWADLRRRVDQFTQPVNDLWLEAKRWEVQGIARIRQPHGSPEFVRLHADLRRTVDERHRNLIQRYLDDANHRGSLPQPSVADTLVVSVDTAESNSAVSTGGLGRERHTTEQHPTEGYEVDRSSSIVAPEMEYKVAPDGLEAFRTVPHEETSAAHMPRASFDIPSGHSSELELDYSGVYYRHKVDDQPMSVTACTDSQYEWDMAHRAKFRGGGLLNFWPLNRTRAGLRQRVIPTGG